MHLADEHRAIEQRLIRNCSYVDYDGQRIDIPFNDEEYAAFQRMNMLEDLMKLSIPVKDTEWGLEMHFRMCPCNPVWEN
jgi:hypothetical protein